MSQLKLEAESVQVSAFCNIILNILKKHKQLSLNKILFFSYLIKKNHYFPTQIYNGNNTQDIIYKGISLLSGDYQGFCNSIEFIIKAIHVLNKSGQVNLKDDIVHSLPNVILGNTIFEESKFIEKAIEASRKMTDRQFMREVTNNV